MNYRWKKAPTQEQLKTIAKIISWNIWQMDGLTCEVPLGGPETYNSRQTVITGFEEKRDEKIYSKIRNWRNGNSVRTFYFKDLRKESE